MNTVHQESIARQDVSGDPREQFDQLPDLALMDTKEFAQMLPWCRAAKNPEACLRYAVAKGIVPARVIRAHRVGYHWVVGDVRAWLRNMSSTAITNSPVIVTTPSPKPARQRIGRPRNQMPSKAKLALATE